MRKHLSVFMLFVRSSFMPTVILCLLLAASQIAYYFFAAAEETMPLEAMMENKPFAFIFMVFFALMVKWLCQSCTARKAKPAYFLHRLNVRPSAIFLWQSLSNVLFLLLFFAAEVLTMLFISAHFVSSVGEEYATSQSLMLAFYRCDFLHSLLPMEETSRWIRNLAIIIGMAIICANCSRKLRLGKLAVFLPAIAIAFVALTFVTEMGEGGLDGFCIAVMLLVPAVLTALVLTGGEEVEDEPLEQTP